MALRYSVGRIGFIGSGGVAWALGSLASKSFNLGFYDVDPSKASRLAESLGGAVFDTLEGLTSWSDLIIVSVPGDVIPMVLENVFELLNENNDRVVAVTDVSTFKSKVMDAYNSAPSNVLVASSHPLFGRRVSKPHAHRALIVPVPGREGEATYIEDFYRKLGVKTSVVDWKTHDLMIAKTIGASYLVGLAVRLLHKDTDLDILEAFMSTTFTTLWVLAEAVSSDSRELIREITRHPETVKMAGKLADLVVGLAKEDIEVIPGNSRAYEYIYRLVEELKG